MLAGCDSTAIQDRLLDSVISRLLSDSGCATATQQNAGAEAQTIIQPNAPWVAAPQIVTPTVEVQTFQVPSPDNQQRRKRSAALALPDEQTKRMKQQQNLASGWIPAVIWSGINGDQRNQFIKDYGLQSYSQHRDEIFIIKDIVVPGSEPADILAELTGPLPADTFKYVTGCSVTNHERHESDTVSH